MEGSERLNKVGRMREKRVLKSKRDDYDIYVKMKEPKFLMGENGGRKRLEDEEGYDLRW